MQFKTPLRTFESPAFLLDDDGHVFHIDGDGDYAPSTQRLDDYTPNALKDMTLSLPGETVAVRGVLAGYLGRRLSERPSNELRFEVNGRELRLCDDLFVLARLPHSRDGWINDQHENVGALMVGPAWLLDVIAQGGWSEPKAPGPRSRLSPLAERLAHA